MSTVSETRSAGNGTIAHRTMIQMAALLFGVVFLLVGVAGFVPGLTADFERLDVFGDVAARLLGVFGINWLENLVHLAYGVGGLVLAATAPKARAYFVGGGALYMLVALYGFVVGTHHEGNILGVNQASNWLHVVLSLTMVGIGVVLGRDARAGR